MTPTYRPPDWERQDWTNGEKLMCAALPAVAALVTVGMWIAWKLWG